MKYVIMVGGRLVTVPVYEECPSCGSDAIEHIHPGKWHCTTCEYTWTTPIPD